MRKAEKECNKLQSSLTVTPHPHPACKKNIVCIGSRVGIVEHIFRVIFIKNLILMNNRESCDMILLDTCIWMIFTFY